MSKRVLGQGRRRRPWRTRLGAGIAVTIVVMAASVASAAAHVVVSSPDAKPGAELGELIFRVPNESAKAATITFAVNLPTSTPFAEVLAQSEPGWVSKTTTKLSPPVNVGGFRLSEVVSTITWTATGDTQILPGQFDEFALSVGLFLTRPLP